MVSQWVVAPSWSDVSHIGWLKKSSTHFLQLQLCSSLSLLRLPIWSFFTALLLGSPFPHTVYFPFMLLLKDPSADAHLALFWHCLLRVCSQCCQCGSWQLLTQSVSPSEPAIACSSEPRHYVSLFPWVLCCQPSFIQGGGCSVVGLPRNTMICTLEQLFNLRHLLVGVL